ncbi:antirestriction protein [Bacillus thermophilus]|uniref:Antirestriction protein ArdA n=2 Tax=Siminovitchia TaxID=2837510 RepID=A0A429X9S7_SIMTE|nr:MULTISPECIES: antirestriction protein ArdA [Siminovitchia]MBM7715320.1 antirestriction protein [Siminovitchia thermophila]RST60150.1 antirestriction protein ArdA [Siminovitchia terrae]
MTNYKINIWVGNLGKYNEGKLVGDWFTLPHDVSDIMQTIGVADGTEYEEWEIFDYEKHPFVNIGRYSSIGTLNELAELIQDLSEEQLEIVRVLMEQNVLGSDTAEHVKEAIEVVKSGEGTVYSVIRGYNSYKELAEMIAVESGLITEDNPLYGYIDFELYANKHLFLHTTHYPVKDGVYVEWLHG